ncbi:MAG TPA: ATP-binding cassette domain-containing protein [Mycobacteriales bacterium]|nr:ATP-binding cassette domain-containing protein [Mycobacteriales bacterium]
MTQTTPVIATERLTKRYGRRTAVDELTVEIPRGTVAGFIGPNGAGKTTTMAMLLGLVRPTAGRGTVLGEPISHPERYINRVGALLEAPAMWPSLTSVDNLTVLARLSGHDEKRIPEVLDLVGLADRSGDRFGKYSLGMKQRLGIAATLLGQPDLLILDEPTNGLDPMGMSDMRDLIRRVASEDRTVLVSSHVLSELEQVCDWLFIVDHGRLIYSGESSEFIVHGDEILLSPMRLDDLIGLGELVARQGFEVGRDGDQLVVPVDDRDPRATAATLNSAAASAGIVLAELHVRRPTLESNYLKMLSPHAVEGEVA